MSRSRRRAGRTAPLALALGLAAGSVTSGCGDPIAVIGDIPGITRIVAGVPNQPGETAAPLATDSEIADPAGIAIAPDGRLFVAEAFNSRIAAVTSTGEFEILVADRLCTSSVCLEEPVDLALDPEGRVVVADSRGLRVWRVDPDTGEKTVLAGTGALGPSPDGTPATEATLQDPRGVAVGEDGTVYFTERSGHRVRYIDGGGALRTLAGTGADGFSGDGGPAAEAEVSAPGGLGIAPGVLYLADSGNDRIRAIDLDGGGIETVAGNGIRGFSEDGVPATSSALAFPEDVAATPDGRRIFIADTQNHRVRHVPLDTGVIETFAGTGTPDFTGDEIDAGAVGLERPSGVTTGPFGFLFVTDPGHDVVWRVVLGF